MPSPGSKRGPGSLCAGLTGAHVAASRFGYVAAHGQYAAALCDAPAALFAAMNAAMARGDEEETSRLMAQIKDAGASMPAADGDL